MGQVKFSAKHIQGGNMFNNHSNSIALGLGSMRIAILFGFVGILAGCQTTAVTNANVDPDEAALVRELFGTTCSLKRTKGSNEKQLSVMMQETSILSITPRDNHWRAADMAYRGFRGNFYYNPRTAQVICGAKGWSNFQRGMYAPPQHPNLLVDANDTSAAKTEARPIAVKWEGYKELFSGKVYIAQNGRVGSVAIIMPNNEGKCTGRYDAETERNGSWRIKCSNGLSANGEYTAFGDGQGASGTGVDSEGRKVTYTLGGRS